MASKRTKMPRRKTIFKNGLRAEMGYCTTFGARDWEESMIFFLAVPGPGQISAEKEL